MRRRGRRGRVRYTQVDDPSTRAVIMAPGPSHVPWRLHPEDLSIYAQFRKIKHEFCCRFCTQEGVHKASGTKPCLP